MPWSYADARAFLADRVDPALAPGARRAGSLARMRALCDALGDPQRATPVVHVTGTNGKGSVARLASGLLIATGATVGTSTSPDLDRPNERIAVGLEPIADDDFAAIVEVVARADQASAANATYVELLHAAAFAWFRDVAVSVAVVEVGRGGRTDASNVADGAVAIVTNVGTDHAEVIGPTRADIAYEKAGIVKRGSVLVLGETDPALVAVFVREAAATGSEVWQRDRDFGCTANAIAAGGRVLDLHTRGARYERVVLGLHGAHQGDNAAAALAGVEAFLGHAVDDRLVRHAFGRATSPGRFEIVGTAPLVVLDGAHDEDGARAAAAALAEMAPDGDVVLVVGMLQPHDPAAMLRAFGVPGRVRHVIASAPASARAITPAAIASAARALGVPAETAPDASTAVRVGIDTAGPGAAVLVTGSLYFVAEARRAAPYHDPP